MAKAKTPDRPDRAGKTACLAGPGQDVLRARAKALARAAADQAAPARQGLAGLKFSIGRQSHALDGAYVLEVFLPREIVPVPGVPEFVLGVTPWRGEILPVVDLRTVCGLAVSPQPGETGETGRAPVVVVGRDEAACGLLVSAVAGACRIKPDDLAAIEGGADLFLLGMAPGGVIVIDVEKLLASERLVVREDESSLEST